MDPEQMLERAQMCLSEAGHGSAARFATAVNGRLAVPNSVPLFVAWRAAALGGFDVCCWPCTRRHGWGFVDLICDHPTDPFVREDAEATA